MSTFNRKSPRKSAGVSSRKRRAPAAPKALPAPTAPETNVPQTETPAPSQGRKRVRAAISQAIAETNAGNGGKAQTLAAVTSSADPYLLKIDSGDGRLQVGQECGNLSAAQSLYCYLRDESKLGASEWPQGSIYRDGTQIATISYNGRVWDMSGALIQDIADATLHSIDPPGAPAAPTQEDLAAAVAISIPVQHIHAALAIAPKKDVRAYLNAIYVHVIGEELRVAATDGKRLIVISSKLERQLPWGEAGLIIPREELARIAAYVGKPKANEAMSIEIAYGVGHPVCTIAETGGMARFTVKPLSGNWPDYRNILQNAAHTLTAQREPMEGTAVKADYMKSAGAIAAQLGSEAVFPWLSSSAKSGPCLFTFSKHPGVLLIITPMDYSGESVSVTTMQIIGADGMRGSLAALKAHETRARKAAEDLKGPPREELLKKADGYKARQDEIRAAVSLQLTGPKGEEKPAAAAVPAKAKKQQQRKGKEARAK